MNGQELLGKQFGTYLIEGIVGQGTAAIIYRALDKNDKPVALKVVFPPVGDATEILARFQREASTAARLKHPNIVPILDSGEFEGRAFLVMPLIQGESLADILSRSTRLTEIEAIDIIWQIANALDYAHLEGVTHRDVKPSNILITKDQKALLSDFGVAQALDPPALTQAGHIVGTPSYMAPEQAGQDGKVDRRADLYSLGITLYRLVCGRLPFRGNTPQLLHAHVYERPPAPSSVARVSPAMEAIILRAIAKNPNDRYQAGSVMAQALSRLSYQLKEEKENQPPLQAWFQGCASRLRFGAVLLAIPLFIIGLFFFRNNLTAILLHAILGFKLNVACIFY